MRQSRTGICDKGATMEELMEVMYVLCYTSSKNKMATVAPAFDDAIKSAGKK